MVRKIFWSLIGSVIVLTLTLIVLALVFRVQRSATTSVPEASVPEAVSPAPPITPAPQAGTPVPVSQVREFTIRESNFRLEPNIIRVKRGERVRITALTDGGFHNVFVAGYNVKTTPKGAGESDVLEFIADRLGTFEMWCEVGAHKAQGMTGQLIVEE